MIAIRKETLLPPELFLSVREVEELLKAQLELFGWEGAGLDVRLVDDAAISVVNERHLGCTGPTNVLSFPSGDEPDEDGRVWIGEMVLSVETLMRECHLYGQPPREHFCRLCAHSLLHLLGFDHGPEMDALTDEAVDQCL